ncbi:unnamed protein product, partial [Nesidiocoris tenuis]
YNDSSSDRLKRSFIIQVQRRAGLKPPMYRAAVTFVRVLGRLQQNEWKELSDSMKKPIFSKFILVEHSGSRSKPKKPRHVLSEICDHHCYLPRTT